MEAYTSFVGFMNNLLYQPYIVPLFLIVAGIFFTVCTKFIQFRCLKETFRVVSEKPSTEGGISSFGALMVSTASRVGTGNIIGVSTALCKPAFACLEDYIAQRKEGKEPKFNAKACGIKQETEFWNE